MIEEKIEKEVIKKSIVTFLIGVLGGSIVSILLKDYTIVLGLLLGYIIDLGSFMLTVKFTDMLLLVQDSTGRISIIMFIMKLGIYALGLYIAIKIPTIFHIISVVIGYFITKITIYLTMSKNTGGA
jgi:hypothetical protein